MNKINIKLYQDNQLSYEKDLNATVNHNKITYFDDVLTQVEKTDNGLFFKRSNASYEFFLNINKENTCTYLLKKEHKLFDINVLTASYKYAKNLVEIWYEIESNEQAIHLLISIK